MVRYGSVYILVYLQSYTRRNTPYNICELLKKFSRNAVDCSMVRYGSVYILVYLQSYTRRNTPYR